MNQSELQVILNHIDDRLTKMYAANDKVSPLLAQVNRTIAEHTNTLSNLVEKVGKQNGRVGTLEDRADTIEKEAIKLATQVKTWGAAGMVFLASVGLLQIVFG